MVWDQAIFQRPFRVIVIGLRSCTLSNNLISAQKRWLSAFHSAFSGRNCYKNVYRHHMYARISCRLKLIRYASTTTTPLHSGSKRRLRHVKVAALSAFPSAAIIVIKKMFAMYLAVHQWSLVLPCPLYQIDFGCLIRLIERMCLTPIFDCRLGF